MKTTRLKPLAKEWAFTLLAGIIVHFAIYSNWLTNPDGLAVFGEYYANGWEISLGRFLLPVLDRIRDGMNAPVLNAVYGLALFSLAAVFINEILPIKNTCLRYLVSICTISSPLVANLLTYYYMFAAYGISMLSAVFSVYFLITFHSKWYSIPVSSVLLMVALGLYQSSLGVAVGLCAAILMLELIGHEKSLPEIGRQIIRFLVYGILGVGLYYLILKIVLNVKNIEIADYAGIGSFGLSELISNLLPGIRQTYADFTAYFCNDTIMSNAYGVKEAYCALGILAAFFFLICLALNGKKIVHSLLAIIILALLPVACNCSVLIAAGTTIILRTAWGMLIIVPLAGAFVDIVSQQLATRSTKIHWNKMLKALRAAICVACIVLIAGNASIVNMDALVMKTSDAKYTQLSNRICMDIEQNQYYQNGGRVAIIGVPSAGNYPVNVMTDHSAWVSGYTSIYNKTNHYAHWELIWSAPNMVYSGWKRVFIYKLGMNLNWCYEYEFNAILDTPEFAAMPNYPADGSIAVINDVLVVKVSDL